MAAPTVTAVSPTSGPLAGGTAVTVTGTDFIAGTTVAFDGNAATSVVIGSTTSITCVSPAHAAGVVDITVNNTDGTSATGAPDQFTYLPIPTVTGVSPSAGPLLGGETVTLTGTGFTGATAVKFGLTNAPGFTVVSDTTITVPAPTKTAGIRTTFVVTPGGTNTPNPPGDQFNYLASLTVISDFVDIDWTQRAQILNQIGTLINNYLTYWQATATPVKVPDPGSGGTYRSATGTLASYVTALNAVNTQFTLGVTAVTVPTDVDFNSFQYYINIIIDYLRKLHTAKP